jgi:hypothetical protein
MCIFSRILIARQIDDGEVLANGYSANEIKLPIGLSLR